MITPYNILRHELIGLDVEIVEASNPSLVGVKGRVVDETRNTLIIEKSNGKEIVVPKDIAVFKFKLGDNKYVKVIGSLLIGRPEDRLKRKIKNIYPY
ncbi:ribonuclease P protein component 1 [Methanofervidicoccus sp. A16]|uniref:ribonuclease P protein component 1 n=1 Tax=Methanofervidicoccus sp. A16 TaxID=2607662 RepID=UPI00118B3C14|nr:ribonuclease P protein component 1 [Methanofervidicoccus sp. A16]AXI25209.1 ribonuclease P protein component 1 [Methanofervidicoccus sp. A16]